ncbi:MAG: tetratricopeptide repeat protein [Proteobacteria bacterium]|nr:tetratricopeptide repeat protein [Pseudomonadota bacterium]
MTFPSGRNPGLDRKKPVFAMAIALALALLTALVFLPSIRCGFIYLDDPDYVFENPVVQGFSVDHVRDAFSLTTPLDLWLPVTWISYMADHALWGLNPTGYHLTNVLFHAANAAILFLLLSRLTGVFWPSFLVAALFAVHPLRVESVAWITERKDVLMAFFWFLAMGAYLRYVKARSWGWYLAALLCCALGLMAKPMLVTLPFFLLLLDYWPLNRLDAGALRTRAGMRRAGFLALEKLPFLAICGLAAWANVLVAARRGAFASADAIPLSGRLANAMASYGAYLGQTFLPTGLALPYPYPYYSWTSPAVLASAAVLAAVTAGVLVRARKQPWLFTGWFWFLGTLTPVIGITQAGMQAHADRFTYVPQIGLFLMLAWGAAELAQRRPGVGKPLAVALGLGLALLAGASLARIGDWKDTHTLFAKTLETTGENWEARHYLGIAYGREGKLAEAAGEYEKALAENPRFAHAHGNLGMVLWRMGQPDEALGHLEEAVKLDPGFAQGRNNLGALLADRGRLPEAVEQYRAALAIRPRFAQAHANLGRVLYALDRALEAEKHLITAVSLEPGYAQAWNDLGVARASLGDAARAEAAFRRALALSPMASAAFRLANLYRSQGRMSDARAWYQKTLAIDPGHSGARAALAGM